MTSSLQKGIEAAKHGQMDEALSHLKDAIIDEPENANVWVWLSAIIEDETKQEFFLRKALEIDPENRPAQRGLAFIERKKIVPPKPGEKLSDYTQPIGLFRNEPPKKTPDTTGNSLSPHPELERTQNEPQKTADFTNKKPIDEVKKVEDLKRSHNWLDVILYTLILLVFVFIGILAGSTIFKVDLPFLSTPTPVIENLPDSEGVFVRQDQVFLEMETHLGPPKIEDGIPKISKKIPEIIISSTFVNVDNLELLFEDGSKTTY